MQCLLNAVSGATSYDGGYDFAIQLADRRVLHLYERRGSRPVKEGASQLDTLVEVASSLRPAETLRRASARDICASLPIGPTPYVVAAAFDSTAASVVKWHETPLSPGGPRPVSQWRDHPATERVAVCYLDGDFGSAKGPPPMAGNSATPLPNWNRVVYLVGADRRPIGVVFGWQDRIPIRDPGP